MREINQPIVGGLKTSPQKPTTQHSHTSGSDREDDLGQETQVEVNRDAMVVDEGADDDPQGVNEDQVKEVGEEEDEEVEEPPIFDDIPDDDEELEDQDDNGEGGQNEGQPQGQTPVTPITELFQRVSELRQEQLGVSP